MGRQGRDPFEDFVDAALTHYGDVEPRVGIEGRVLANLAARRARSFIWSRSVWAGSAVSALVVVLGIWLGHSSGGNALHEPLVRGKTPITAAPVPAPKPVQAFAGRTREARTSRGPLRVAVRVEAKLPQFPSPRPIGEQEIMLIEYVQHYPGEATLVAKQQDAFQAAVEQAERELGENSTQQER